MLIYLNSVGNKEPKQKEEALCLISLYNIHAESTYLYSQYNLKR